VGGVVVVGLGEAGEATLGAGSEAIGGVFGIGAGVADGAVVTPEEPVAPVVAVSVEAPGFSAEYGCGPVGRLAVPLALMPASVALVADSVVVEAGRVRETLAVRTAARRSVVAAAAVVAAGAGAPVSAAAVAPVVEASGAAGVVGAWATARLSCAAPGVSSATPSFDWLAYQPAAPSAPSVTTPAAMAAAGTPLLRAGAARVRVRPIGATRPSSAPMWSVVWSVMSGRPVMGSVTTAAEAMLGSAMLGSVIGRVSLIVWARGASIRGESIGDSKLRGSAAAELVVDAAALEAAAPRPRPRRFLPRVSQIGVAAISGASVTEFDEPASRAPSPVDPV
jgi:hypothetical protein